MSAKRALGSIAALILVGALSLPAFGQATTGGGTGGAAPGGAGAGAQPGGGRNRGNFAQFRQGMLDRLKTELGATDEEFTALQPKIEAVFNAQRDTRGGGFRGNRGPGGGGAPGGAAPTAGDTPAPAPSAVQQASTDLRTLLENKDAKPEDIKAKLTALRDARSKAKETLAKAQEDLKQLVTQRQEAVLVQYGLLD